MKTQSALPWFGSDALVASDIAALFPKTVNHVTIPFCGGLGILPFLTVRSIVARRCQSTLSHPSEMKGAMLALGSDSAYERAWGFWALSWIGRKGKGGTRHQGGMPSVRRTANGGSNASRLRSAANDLEEWAEHFRRCEFECLDFRELLPKVADNPACGIYADPPWVGAGDDYLHRFAEEDHRDLRRELDRFRHTFIVIRYGDAPLIRDLYREWNIQEAECRTQANTQRREIWITRQ